MKDVQSSQLDLQATARQVMLEHGFEPDFPAEVPQQLARLKTHPPQVAPSADIRDLRQLLWSSIDNDTSRDLDQVEVAERLATGGIKVLVGIADVDAFVPEQSPIDQHAARETTTVYTGIKNFPMLPEELSTGRVFAARRTGQAGDRDRVHCGPGWRGGFQPGLPRRSSQPGAACL